MGRLRREAWIAAGMIGLASALLLTGYDATRTTAEAQLSAAYGEGAEATLLSWMPVGVLAVVFAAGWALSRLGARRTFRWTAGVSALALALCDAGVLVGWRPAALGLAFVREVYVVLMIEQLWSFLNSTLVSRESKALNGPVTGIGSVGAILGSMAMGPLSGVLGPKAMPMLSVASVLLAMVLVDRVYARLGEPQPGPEEATRKGELGLGPLRRSRTLLFLFGIVLCTRVLSATVSLGFEGAVAHAVSDPTAQGAMEDGVYNALNAIIAVMQFVAAPLLLSNLPTGLVWVGLPVLQFAASCALFFWPSVGTAAACLVMFRSFEYSLFRDTKELFYQPMSFEVRYRTKLLLDVFGHRFGKAMLALALGAPVLANARLVAWSPALSVAATAVWVGLAVGMVRANGRGGDR